MIRPDVRLEQPSGSEISEFSLTHVGNQKVIDSLNLFRREGMKGLRAAFSLLSLFKPLPVGKDNLGLIRSEETKPETLADQLGWAYAKPQQLTEEQKGSLTALQYFCLESLANSPQIHRVGGEERDLSQKARQTAKDVFEEYNQYLAKTLDPDNPDTTGLLKMVRTGGKIARMSFPALALWACNVLTQVSPIVELPPPTQTVAVKVTPLPGNPAAPTAETGVFTPEPSTQPSAETNPVPVLPSETPTFLSGGPDDSEITPVPANLWPASITEINRAYADGSPVSLNPNSAENILRQYNEVKFLIERSGWNVVSSLTRLEAGTKTVMLDVKVSSGQWSVQAITAEGFLMPIDENGKIIVLPNFRPDWATRNVAGYAEVKDDLGVGYNRAYENVNSQWVPVTRNKDGKVVAHWLLASHDFVSSSYKLTGGEYLEEIENIINIYAENYPELLRLRPKEVTVINASGGESVTILNYTESVKTNPDSVAQIYDYFTSVSIKNLEYDYEKAPRFKVFGTSVPNNTVIALIPSDLATLRTHANKSHDGALPNMIYIKVFSQSEINPLEKDMYSSGRDKTINFLENEICQVTNTVLPMGSNYFTETERLEWVPVEQEIYCNSLSRTYYLRQKGVSWEEYVRIFSGLYLIDPSTGKRYSMLTFTQDYYNSIPFLTSPPLYSPK